MSNYPVGTKWKCVNADGSYSFVWLEKRDGDFEVWRWNWRHKDGSHSFDDSDWGPSKRNVIEQVKSTHVIDGRFKRVLAAMQAAKAAEGK